MLVKIMVYVTLTVMIIGFLWFGAQVVYLGTREFFKNKKNEKINENNKNKKGNK